MSSLNCMSSHDYTYMHCVVVQLSYSVATINSHQDRETLCKNRYARVTADGQKIMELVKQNLGYFQVRK